jgi:sugar phosphate isomerase/epimerase
VEQPLIMHVNYCEQGQTLAEICRKAVAWGFDGVEFRSRRARDADAESYLDALARAVQEAGLRHVLFGGPGPDLMQPDAAAREAEVARYAAFLRAAAARFRLTVCNTMAGNLMNPVRGIPYGEYERHGSFAAQSHHWEWAAEGFRALAAVAENLGVRLAFETHMCYLHDTPEATRRLVDLIGHPAVGITFDYGNIVALRQAPPLAEALERCGDRIVYVHLKNSLASGTGARIAVALGDGEINHREYLRLLRTRGFDGPIAVEAPRAGDREWFARQDHAYIRSVMAELGD